MAKGESHLFLRPLRCPSIVLVMATFLYGTDIPVTVLDLFTGIDIGTTFGAILLGTFLGLTLYGVNLHQTYRYFRLFPKDARLLRLLVFVTFGLETMHTVLSIHICYYYLVTSYFNPTALLTGIWSIKVLSLNMGAVMFVSQSFFARRVYLLGRHQRVLAFITCLLLLGELAFATAATAETYIQVTFERFSRVSWVIVCAYAMAVVADGTVAVSLVLALRRSRAHHDRTESLLDVVLVYTVNTGVLTGVLSIFSLIFAIIYSDNLIYVGFNSVTTRLYANALLAVLNSRRSPVDRGIEGFETGSLGLAIHPDFSVKTTAEQWNVPPPPPAVPTVIDIKVTTEMVRDVPLEVEHSELGSQKDLGKHFLV